MDKPERHPSKESTSNKTIVTGFRQKDKGQPRIICKFNFLCTGMCIGFQPFQPVQAYSGTRGREYCPAGGAVFSFDLRGVFDLFQKAVQRIDGFSRLGREIKTALQNIPFSE